MRAQSRRAGPEAGFTLSELLVVVAITAVLAAIAVPALTRDRSKDDFEKLVDQLAQDLQAARFQAIASKQYRDLQVIGTDTYKILSVDPTTSVDALLRQQTVPPTTEITGFKLGASETSGQTAVASSDTRIRFSMVSSVQVKGAGLNSTCPGGTSTSCSTDFCTCAITIYLRSTAGSHYARLIVYKATGYTRRLEGW